MEKAHIATAKGMNLPLSRKHSVEVASFIRGKEVSKVKKMLDKVLKKESAVPFKRFNRDKGHKRGMAAGRFPENSTKAILSLIESAEANAQNKGLNTQSLVLSSIIVNQGTTQWRHGRQRRRQAKRCHIEVALTEKEEKKKPAKEEKNETPKAEAKKK